MGGSWFRLSNYGIVCWDIGIHVFIAVGNVGSGEMLECQYQHTFPFSGWDIFVPPLGLCGRMNESKKGGTMPLVSMDT